MLQVGQKLLVEVLQLGQVVQDTVQRVRRHHRPSSRLRRPRYVQPEILGHAEMGEWEYLCYKIKSNLLTIKTKCFGKKLQIQFLFEKKIECIQRKSMTHVICKVSLYNRKQQRVTNETDHIEESQHVNKHAFWRHNLTGDVQQTLFLLPSRLATELQMRKQHCYLLHKLQVLIKNTKQIMKNQNSYFASS